MSEFIPTFDITEISEIKNYMQINGYVVIRDILTSTECQTTAEDINQQIKANDSRFNLYDPSTYDYMKTHGLYGMITKSPIFTDQFLMNRQNPRLIEAFKMLYPKDMPLIVNHDRFSFYRPTLSPGKESYKTPYTYPNLHLDMDPQMYIEHQDVYEELQKTLTYNNNPRDFITENNYLSCKDEPIYQALLNIWDNQYNDGGLHLVPGFHNKYKEWYYQKKFKTPPGMESGFQYINLDPIDMKYVHSPIRIPLPAGAIVIWDKRLAHGSIPNNSGNGRIIQFVVVRPKSSFLPEVYQKRTKELQKIMKKTGFIKKINKEHLFW